VKYRNVDELVREEVEDMESGERFKTEEMARAVGKDYRRVLVSVRSFVKTGLLRKEGLGKETEWIVI